LLSQQNDDQEKKKTKVSSIKCRFPPTNNLSVQWTENVIAVAKVIDFFDLLD
jgi:hypothetical protein